jgi:FKBP-type peptidyl-prolyl cis-trans isomerase FkpA
MSTPRFIIFCSLLSLLLSIGCANDAPKDKDRTTQSETAPPPVDEDAAILQLSSYLIATPANLAEEQQNTIVNYAIDNIIPLEQTNTGLFYRIISAGEGAPLKWGNYIRVHYKGHFLDGKVFDSSYRRDKPLDFYIGNMVSGWNEGLQLISPGGRIQLFLPSALAYGEDGFPDGKDGFIVPPNTILAFEIEVLELLKEK